VKKRLLIFVALLILSGCASLAKSDWYNQIIEITSEPSGAVIILNGKPAYIYKDIPSAIPGETTVVKRVELERTPKKVRFYLNDAPFVVRLEKEGYQPFEIRIEERLSGWSLLNLINIIGWHIDDSTGASDTLKPAKIHAVLKMRE
jgi:hypothetical protein